MYVMFSRVFLFFVFVAMGVTDDVKSDLSRRKVLCFGNLLFYLFYYIHRPHSFAITILTINKNNIKIAYYHQSLCKTFMQIPDATTTSTNSRPKRVKN